MTMYDFYDNLCEPFGESLDESFETAFSTADDIDLDPSDLAEWMDDKYESGLDLSDDITLDSLPLIDDATVISTDMFENDRHIYTRSKRKRSRSPPRKRLRQLSPERVNKSSKKFQMKPIESTSSSSFVSFIPKDNEYNETMSKMVSEISQATSIDPLEQPSPSTLSSLVGLLTGKRTSLTNGLEYSRTHLRTYMSLMLSNRTL